MKSFKVLAPAALAAALVGLTACGQEKTPVDAPTAAPNEAATVQPSPPPMMPVNPPPAAPKIKEAPQPPAPKARTVHPKAKFAPPTEKLDHSKMEGMGDPKN